jgi:site-specific DNA-cytosine methylase
LDVLVACEFSGIVRDAFIARGHNAFSCDFLESESPGPHFIGDIREWLDKGWDLMIAHPPCTHLAVSGARWFKEKEKEQLEALEFVRLLLDAPIGKIALENPVSIISSRIRKPTQIIQPWMFGHDASKTTCLWLKNLPLLQPTKIIPPKIINGGKRWANQTSSGQNKLGPSLDRWKERSRTYTGIAQAMAEQWG